MKLKSILAGFDAHHRLFWAAAAAAAGAVVLPSSIATGTRIVAGWNFFALADLILAGFVVTTKDPAEVRRSVTLQDSGRTFLFVLVIAAACVSVGSVAFLLGGLKNESGGIIAGHVILTVVTIVLTWLMTHTLFALRYAHLYYRPDSGAPDESPHAGGLIFPGGEDPDYGDFLYYSLVVGMTCQVSDVQVESRGIRRLTLLHGVLSFGFNTIVLALTINILSGLLF